MKWRVPMRKLRSRAGDIMLIIRAIDPLTRGKFLKGSRSSIILGYMLGTLSWCISICYAGFRLCDYHE